MLINSVGGGGGIELSLVISVASGSVVTATKGGKSVTGTAVDGVCVLTVPEAGVWTVSATLNGVACVGTQTVKVFDQYSVTLGVGLLSVGDSAFLNVGGIKTEFLVVHQGKPSADYDDSCDGTWLLAKPLLAFQTWNSADDNRYALSDVHSYLNGDFISSLDAGVQGAVREAKIPYIDGYGNTGTIKTGSEGLAAKAFLLSWTELGFTNKDSDYPIFGAKLDYFEESTAGMAKRIAYSRAGVVSIWWTRTPSNGRSYGTGYLAAVKDDGDWVNYAPTRGQYGVRPALILPQDTYVDGDHNIVIPA